MSDIEKDHHYQRGYDQALRDAVKTLAFIRQHAVTMVSPPRSQCMVLALDVAEKAIATLEPGYFLADEPCPTSPTAN